jgi:hypothetical protein
MDGRRLKLALLIAANVFLLFLVVLALFLNGMLEIPFTQHSPPSPSITPNGGSSCLLANGTDFCTSPAPNRLKTGPNASERVEIRLNEPVEFDWLTKREVLSMRNMYVSQYDLVEGNYSPYSPVFGQIDDKKPWWGVTGQFCNSEEYPNIEGPSEESRSVINPYLLLVLDQDFVTYDYGNCTPAYPRPISLVYYPNESSAVAVYNLTRLAEEQKSNHWSRFSTNFTLFLYSFNARDFGYEFAYADLNKSAGIAPDRVDGGRIADGPVQLLTFIHLGGSCRYEGGCNNGSPFEPDTGFVVSEYPSHINFKLWKSNPQSTGSKADFSFEIDFV